MNCFEIVDHYADEFTKAIKLRDSVPIAIDEYPWKNQLWSSSRYRRAHVEEFSTPAIKVLHVTVFPHLSDPAPIFGFDVVTGAKKPAGCYFDLSPSLHSWKWRHILDPMNLELPKKKTIPEWGTCFSDEFIAVAPQDEKQLEDLLLSGLYLLRVYLQRLHIMRENKKEVARCQQFYCEQQRSNQKTRQILERMIGAERTEKFMSEVLFPNPPDPVFGIV
jgi:phycocyanobilin:ferredoxin oxidoreductase